MRIGIVGSGLIVGEALRTFRLTAGVVPSAICVRKHSLEKGRELAKQNGIAQVFDDYGDFLRDGSFDVVYIGIVNTMHYAYTKQALEAGRHVILEKPFTTTAAEAEELVELAKSKGVFLFEAVTSLFTDTFRFVRQRLPEIGEVKLVQCNYSQYSSRYDAYMRGEVAPAFDPALFGGALYDINIYNLHIVAALFGEPEEVRYYKNRGFNGVDTSGIAVLGYRDFVAECTGAKDSQSPGFVTIQGTKGFLQLLGAPNVCPSARLEVGNKVEICENPHVDVRMAPEFLAFREMWEQGDYKQCYEWLDHSLRVMRVVDAAWRE